MKIKSEKIKDLARRLQKACSEAEDLATQLKNELNNHLNSVDGGEYTDWLEEMIVEVEEIETYQSDSQDRCNALM